jgi:hypothetical protein
MLTALTAAIAGIVHVLSGPDHIAAVAPLAMAERGRSWFAGWSWGIGHASGVVVVAALAVLLRDLLPPLEVISAWSERMVGGALIVVGLWAVRKGLHISETAHLHDGRLHTHVHVASGPTAVRRLGHAHTAFWMGILHGVAGSSHFLGVLPALALPTRAAALTYVAVFGAASVAAMTGFAAAVGAATAHWSVHSTAAHRAFLFAGAFIAFAVGAVWIAG